MGSGAEGLVEALAAKSRVLGNLRHAPRLRQAKRGKEHVGIKIFFGLESRPRKKTAP